MVSTLDFHPQKLKHISKELAQEQPPQSLSRPSSQSQIQLSKVNPPSRCETPQSLTKKPQSSPNTARMIQNRQQKTPKRHHKAKPLAVNNPQPTLQNEPKPKSERDSATSLKIPHLLDSDSPPLHKAKKIRLANQFSQPVFLPQHLQEKKILPAQQPIQRPVIKLQHQTQGSPRQSPLRADKTRDSPKQPLVRFQQQTQGSPRQSPLRPEPERKESIKPQQQQSFAPPPPPPPPPPLGFVLPKAARNKENSEATTGLKSVNSRQPLKPANQGFDISDIAKAGSKLKKTNRLNDGTFVRGSKESERIKETGGGESLKRHLSGEEMIAVALKRKFASIRSPESPRRSVDISSNNDWN